MTETIQDVEQVAEAAPGATLAERRKELQLSCEYVADKLHLRVCIIEMIEADDYSKMPEKVFVKGYLRAYAKLLDIPADPIIEEYNSTFAADNKSERAMLWQSRKETNKAEKVIRLITASFALLVMIAVIVWWRGNKENEHIFSTNYRSAEQSSVNNENDIRLTDLSKMRSLLSSSNPDFAEEKKGG